MFLFFVEVYTDDREALLSTLYNWLCRIPLFETY